MSYRFFNFTSARRVRVFNSQGEQKTSISKKNGYTLLYKKEFSYFILSVGKKSRSKILSVKKCLLVNFYYLVGKYQIGQMSNKLDF